MVKILVETRKFPGAGLGPPRETAVFRERPVRPLSGELYTYKGMNCGSTLVESQKSPGAGRGPPRRSQLFRERLARLLSGQLLYIYKRASVGGPAACGRPAAGGPAGPWVECCVASSTRVAASTRKFPFLFDCAEKTALVLVLCHNNYVSFRGRYRLAYPMKLYLKNTVPVKSIDSLFFVF